MIYKFFNTILYENKHVIEIDANPSFDERILGSVWINFECSGVIIVMDNGI